MSLIALIKSNKMKAIIKLALINCILYLVILVTNVMGQEKTFPELNKMVPAFALKTDQKNKEGRMTSESLKGTFYVLDFWNTSCGACIMSFPKVDKLQEKFKGKVKLVLVGQEEAKRNVSSFYEVYRKRFHLKINSIFDSTTFRNFVHRGVPHLVWVNDKGIVKAVSISTELTSENIQKFITGEDFDFYDRSYKGSLIREKKFDNNKPLMINGNGGNDTNYIFRSVFSIWKQEDGTPTETGMPVSAGIGRYQALGMPISYLYAVAFFGNVNNILTPDAIFEPFFSAEAKALLSKRFPSNTLLNYSAEIPAEVATRSNMMRKMQNDLSELLGLNAKLKSKELQSYQLEVIDRGKLSKYVTITREKPRFTWRAEDKVHEFQNISMSQFLNIIKSKILTLPRPIVENSTGIKDKLTFKLTAQVDDFESIKEGINELGLQLSSSTKTMQIIEITAGH
jgi:uncharacterized protein (TIGR03435 family)